MAQKKTTAAKKKVTVAKGKNTKKVAVSARPSGAKAASKKVKAVVSASVPKGKAVSTDKKKVTKPAPKEVNKAISKTITKAIVKAPIKKTEKPVKIKIVSPELEKAPGSDQKPAKSVRANSAKVVTPPAPQYVEADKNSPRVKVRTVLISQPKPDSEKSPFLEIARKYNIKMNFRQFIQIDPVPAREFRQQRINLIEHNAVILTSRVAIDHYFRMCNEMRYTVPETTKYFCLTESIAYYLQKYVQYRKRKIFFGNQTINDLVDVIKKHKEEKFLLPVSDVHREKIVDFLDEMKLNYSKATFYRTVCADLSDFNGKLDYDVVVFFTPMGIKSLHKNFPNLKQGDLRIGAFGVATCAAVKESKLRLDIAAPTKETPSMVTALENYIREANKR